MRRALGLLLLLALGVGLALFMRDLGGAVEVQAGRFYLAVPFWLALLALVLGFALLHGLLVAWRRLRGWPARHRARRAERDRREGDAAVTRALVALAAGTADQARLEVREARRLLGDTPQTLVLTAEAERLSGRDGAAVEAYRALAARDDARFLGLRGLLRDAMQRGDWPAAQRLAREAEAVQPGAAWVREERAALALRTRDWREAYALGAPEAPKAALALAASAEEADPERAAELERQALAADPGFTPAALAHARRMEATGSPRRAKVVLQSAWAASPHPELAEAYLAGETDPLARVKGAEALVHGRRDHAESRLLLARTALDAGLTGRARAELEALLAEPGVDRRSYLAMVELEQLELGESAAGRAAEARWLRAAAEAPTEPRWRCAACGAEHPAWAPVCDRCGTVGRIVWTEPGRTGPTLAVVPQTAPTAQRIS